MNWISVFRTKSYNLPYRHDLTTAVPSHPRRRMGLGFAMSSLMGLGALAFLPQATEAATATTTFAVTATVQSTCSVSATGMAFGAYSGTLATSTSTVSVTCSNSTPYYVGLSAGLAGSATVSTRQMTGPSSALLNYSLFSDSSRSVNWGLTDGTDDVAGTGNGSAQSITVYGQIPANQLVTPGSFSDTITATVTY